MQRKQSMPSEILDRLPPHSLEAERAVLGSILLDQKIIDDVSTIIRDDDFYADQNVRLFRHLAAMHCQGKRIDATLLVEQLKQEGEYEATGGAAYLAEVAQSVPYAANAVYYSEIVRERAVCRAGIRLATEALRDFWDPQQPGTKTLESMEAAIAKIRTGQSSEALVDGPAAAMAVVDYVDAIMNRQNRAGIVTGLEKFDNDVGGLFPGEYSVLAGTSSSGKTALACQIADHNAARGRLVYFASLEMEAVELAQRQVCAIGGVNSRAIRTASLSDEDRQKIVDAAEQFAHRAIRIDPRPYLKVTDIRRAARRLLKDGLTMVVVDYIGLIEPDDPKIVREQQVARNSRGLKNLAKELNVPVLVLCQLNRENMPDERPALRHLRESGAIGQDAHMVLFLHRPEEGIVARVAKDKTKVYHPWPAELILAKNRNGQTGIYRLGWTPEKTRFSCWKEGL
jgi:replicative DNA helicase